MDGKCAFFWFCCSSESKHKLFNRSSSTLDHCMPLLCETCVFHRPLVMCCWPVTTAVSSDCRQTTLNNETQRLMSLKYVIVRRKNTLNTTKPVTHAAWKREWFKLLLLVEQQIHMIAKTALNQNMKDIHCQHTALQEVWDDCFMMIVFFWASIIILKNWFCYYVITLELSKWLMAKLFNIFRNYALNWSNGIVIR